ncbi:FAD-binding oxidoreductase [Actinokineospora cianjurensis]|uniref:4-cresol dehydrogenase (Hydroxylating) n=1 Tax=Actinokineospora cianjurensis TaxID=585224 RepID=A0A421BBT6_9PSEU|nr:FAD-binding oxidoreductase [Actinokineospora cianjurensis]RLK61819.1 4-cresol dehydrogenase (hydroxylating) [Actinokineospora cianjurensis]
MTASETASATSETANATSHNGAESQAAGAAAALAAAEGIVGADRVSRGGPGDNTGLFRQRDIVATVRPSTADEAQRVVRAFAAAAGGVSLHAYSTGRNWGLGSRESATDDVVALDLSGLSAIRDIDVAAGWAVVEPGVTQGHLAGLLADTDRMVNVTVSTAHSSVLGNALDRGVGLRHQRVEDLVGLEVVLPDGELVHVGWWPEAERKTPVYPHTLGPSLVQLFVQSNLGIVTGATVRLLPRPEALRVVRLNHTPENLGPATALLRRWVSQGLASGVPKFYNPTAARGYGSAPGQFLAHVPVDGTEASVAALSAIIADEAVKSGVFTEVSTTDATDPDAPHHEVTSLVERSYLGDPDVSDRVFEQKMGMRADQLDTDLGFLFFLPLLPFTAEAVVTAERLLGQVHAETGILAGGTGNVLGDDLVDLVVAMKFDRADAQAAHRALDRLYELFAEQGFLPYRLDVDHHEWIDRVGGRPSARAFARRLKDSLDPTGVIAPGRYL